MCECICFTKERRDPSALPQYTMKRSHASASGRGEFMERMNFRSLYVYYAVQIARSSV